MVTFTFALLDWHALLSSEQLWARGTSAGDCSLPISLTYPRPLQQLFIKKQKARLLSSISFFLSLSTSTANKSTRYCQVWDFAEIWALNTGFSKAGTEKWLNFTPGKIRDEPTPASLQSDLLGYSQTNIPLGSIKIYASSPTHFKINWRDFDQK